VNDGVVSAALGRVRASLVAPGLLKHSAMSGSTPLNIAFVMTSCEAGGTERQMIELMRRLNPERWHVHVACLHARGAWFRRMSESAASVTEFPLKSFSRPDTVRQAWAFMRWCREQGIVVVHTADLYANIFALPAAAFANVPVRIANRREINPDKSIGQIVMQRAAYECAHKIVANSRAAAGRLRREGVPARKVATVSNGVDRRVFVPHPARPRLRHVVVVANLRPEKRHDVLIDAAPEVLRHYPDARFEIVGGGPALRALQARTVDQRVAQAFSFVGHEEDVAARLRNADIFVLPSQSEAFPNAVLEAMSAGLPIVASGVGGILELIDDHRTGLLVPAGDPHALAQGICRLMADQPLGVRLGEAASLEVRGRYSFDRMTAAFEAVYLSELTRRGVAPTDSETVLAS
jgi:glycosyltransferase involved in cell wall biosynthesis